MTQPIDNTVVIEGARLIYLNFRGLEGMYNQEGQRTFSVILDDNVADMLTRDGWNVKYTKPREGDEEELTNPYLPVELKYRNRMGQKTRPPRIVLITSRGRTNLGEDEVDMLDYADIVYVDLIVGPYDYTVRGHTGIKAYLRSLYVTIREDVLEMKYADLNQIPIRGGRIDD